MTRLRLDLLIPVLLIATAMACGGKVTPTEIVIPDPPRDGVFIHVSHGDDEPQRVLMALKMAELMAEDRDVLVYFDIKGIGVVLQDAATISHDAFPSSAEQIALLLDMGVPLYACPGCLKAAGRSAEELVEGIQVANKDAFFDFTEGRILTLDY